MEEVRRGPGRVEEVRRGPGRVEEVRARCQAEAAGALVAGEDAPVLLAAAGVLDEPPEDDPPEDDPFDDDPLDDEVAGIDAVLPEDRESVR